MSDDWSVVADWRDMPVRAPMRVYDKGAGCTEGTRALVRRALRTWKRAHAGWPRLLDDALADLRQCSCILEARLTSRRNPATGWTEQAVEFRVSARPPEVVEEVRRRAAKPQVPLMSIREEVITLFPAVAAPLLMLALVVGFLWFLIDRDSFFAAFEAPWVKYVVYAWFVVAGITFLQVLARTLSAIFSLFMGDRRK